MPLDLRTMAFGGEVSAPSTNVLIPRLIEIGIFSRTDDLARCDPWHISCPVTSGTWRSVGRYQPARLMCLYPDCNPTVSLNLKLTVHAYAEKTSARISIHSTHSSYSNYSSIVCLDGACSMKQFRKSYSSRMPALPSNMQHQTRLIS